MPKFHLTIREHAEFGELGISIKGSPEYFEPALRGDVVAHDIIEHPVTSNPNGFSDEFMALGGFIAGRVANEYMNRYGRFSYFDDVIADVSSLITYMEPDDLEECKSFIRNKDLMQKIRNSVIKGIMEEKDVEYNEVNQNDVNNIVGWICKGYQLFNKRFNDTYAASIILFKNITEECDAFLDNAFEGQEGVLYVNFRDSTAYVEEVYN